MQKFQNILSLSPSHSGPLHDTKTSTFFLQSFSRCNSEKLIRTLGCVINEFFDLKKKYCFVSKYLGFYVFVKSTDFKISDIVIGIATQ